MRLALIVPGIMPISDFQKLMRFSFACQAEVLLWLPKRMQAYRNDIDAIHAYGTEVVSNLCEQFIDYGAPGLPFYTLNQLQPTKLILENLKLAVY